MKKSLTVIMAMIMAVSMLITPVLPAAAANKDYSAVFNADYYYNNNADLQTVIGNDSQKLLQHFLTSGMKEGRRGSAEFNVWFYMDSYPDLMTAFGLADLTSYYEHYMSLGKAEGRNAAGEAAKKSIMATYTTKYRAKTNRASNLELAATRLNGYVIAPGTTFSFSDSIQSRTEANGYVDAPSFADGEVVSSIGGGICQVSSTLYAALKSYGIPAAERYAHSLPVDYVPKGYDATISEGRKDLKFTNNNNENMIIYTKASGGRLTITIVKG